MTAKQIHKYNSLLKRREQLSNFIYLAELPLINTDFGLVSIADFVMIDKAVEIARQTIQEIDNEVLKMGEL